MKDIMRPSRPPNLCESFASPRKVKTMSRLAQPKSWENRNRNSDIDENGERKLNISAVERYYSQQLDDMSDQVHVPTHMRQKLIFAIIETERPKVYHAMKHFQKHFMTSSEARQARTQRQKVKLCKPPTLQQHSVQHIHNQEVCKQSDMNAQELFTEKLIKVNE